MSIWSYNALNKTLKELVGEDNAYDVLIAQSNHYWLTMIPTGSLTLIDLVNEKIYTFEFNEEKLGFTRTIYTKRIILSQVKSLIEKDTNIYWVLPTPITIYVFKISLIELIKALPENPYYHTYYYQL